MCIKINIINKNNYKMHNSNKKAIKLKIYLFNNYMKKI